MLSVKSKDAGAPPPPKISKQNLAKVSTNVKFAWPGTSEENKQHLEQEKSVKKSLKSKPDTPSKSQKEKNVKERSMKKEVEFFCFLL